MTWNLQEALRGGRSLIYEPGLDRALEMTQVETTHDLAYAVESTEITFICVGTPTNAPEDPINLEAIKEVVREMEGALSPHHLVVVKSTVPP